MRKYWFTGVLLVLSSLLALSCGKKPDAVAKVGNVKISTQEYLQAFKQKYRRTNPGQISLEQKKELAINLVDQKLKVLRARELNLDEKPDFTEGLEDQIENLMPQKLFEVKIVNELIPEDLLNNMIDLEQRNLKVTVIGLGYVSTNSVRANRSKAQAIHLANKLVKMIHDGTSPSELSAQYTDNQNLKQKRGLIDAYTPGMFNPKVDKALFDAPVNSIVGPVVTDDGVFIIQILASNPAGKVIDRDAKKENLKRQIYSRYYRQAEGDKRYRELTDKYMEELGHGISDEGIRKFLSAVQEWSQKPEARDNQFPEAQRSIELAHVGGKKITAGYFIDQFRGQFFINYKRYEDPKALRDVLTRHLNYLAWTIEAEKSGIDQRPDVKAQIEKIRDSKLAELYDKYEIREQVKPADADLTRYYEDHKENYMVPRKIEIWEIALKDQAKAQKIYQMAIRPNADFEKLAKEYSEKTGTANRGGKLGALPENSTVRKDVVTTAFDIGPNSISQPFKSGPYYLILKTGQIEAAHRKSLDEVRTSVQGAVRQELEKKLQEQKMDSLKHEYDFWINESLLRNLT